MRIWDLAEGKQTHVLGKFKNPVSAAAFSPDGARIATTSGAVAQFAAGDNLNLGEIKLWDIAGESVLFETEGNVGVGCVAFSPLGDLFAAGRGNQIVFFRVEGEKGVKPPVDAKPPANVPDKAKPDPKPETKAPANVPSNSAVTQLGKFTTVGNQILALRDGVA